MRILQITDQHIGGPNEKPWAVDVRSHFNQLCQKIKAISPDYFVVTGDLCLEQGDTDVYKWIKHKLDEVSIPYFVLSGNHDDPTLIADVFGLKHDLKDDELYYSRQLGAYKVLFLDSTPGTLSGTQLTWLEKELRIASNTPQLIFIHHPPVLAGVSYMDMHYPMVESSRLQLSNICRNSQNDIHLFCGHYHSARTITTAFSTIYITPSSYVQIDPFSVSFKPEHTIPGYRIIDVSEQSVRSAVHYIFNHDT